MRIRSAGQESITQSAASGVQCKLTVGAVNDPLEAQADAVAEQVMRMPESPVVQRKCTHCEEEERVQRKPLVSFIQRKSNTDSPTVASQRASSKIDSTRGGGSPMHPSTRSFMESRFGADFSRVRVHNNAYAADLANELNAQAFTVGRDIYFNTGKYSPETNDGKRLLAHELTHTIQQEQSSFGIQRTLRVENPNQALPGTPAKEHWEDVRDHFGVLSSSFTVNSTGAITPNSAACNSPTRTVDQCLCGLASAANQWKIQIKDDDWPHTDEVNHRVSIHSSRSEVGFGAWGGGPQNRMRLDLPMWRVLGHELCGHAWLMEQGTHPASGVVTQGRRVMSRPGHDATINVENDVARDVLGATAPERGLHTADHSGESFGKVTISEFGASSSQASSLPANMRARIDTAAHFLNSNRLVKADIIGHTDSPGSPSTNASLSLARAHSIRRELNNKGIPTNRFNVVRGEGSSACGTSGNTPDPQCRKVEVFMYIFERSSLMFP